MAKTQRTPKNLDAVAEKLRGEREQLLRQVAELEGEEPTDVYSASDPGEPETATYERERDLSLVADVRDLLEQVDTALAKIADGSYGTCESCGKSIEAARLKALPHASLCISCKRKEERR